MSKEPTIIDLDEHHLPEVLKLCRRELGSDYHSEADFEKCLGTGGGRFCKVVLDDAGAVRGFALSMMLNPQSADQYLKLPASKERDQILSFSKIGILDAAAVDNTLQRGGLGKLLARASRDKLLDKGAEVICSMAWKSVHGVTNAQQILHQNGFTESLAIQGYWNQVVDSREGHHCPVCGEPPCRCYGVLYVRYVS